MSDSIDPVGAASATADPAIHPTTAHAATPSATAASGDTTAEVTAPDGAITIVVTDAQGLVLSTTVIEPADAQPPTEPPHHMFSVTA